MSTITATKTIEQLRVIFATHGLPRKVVTDNGPTFTSEQFRNFMSLNGITHVTTAPYHPSSNGLAERAVQTVKQGLKRTAGSSLQERLSKFLFTYRITPQSTTGVSPSTLLMGRRLRSRLDRLFPDVSKRVETKQSKQAEQHDSSKPLRKFNVSDTVYVKDFCTPSSWISGKIVKVTGPLSYQVELLSRRVVRRHVDAIRIRSTLVPRPKPTTEIVDDYEDFADVTASVPENPYPTPPPPQVRRSTRSCGRPDRLGW